MKRKSKVWRSTAIVCVIHLLITGMVPCSNARGIDSNESQKAIPLSSEETATLAKQDQNSSDLQTISSEGDGKDALAVIGGVFLVLLLICLIAAEANSDDEVHHR